MSVLGEEVFSTLPKVQDCYEMKTRVLGIAYQLAVHHIYESTRGTTEIDKKP